MHPPVQVNLPPKVEPRQEHTATVFGSGPNFRMVVMFGGRMHPEGETPAKTTLFHLGEFAVRNITHATHTGTNINSSQYSMQSAPNHACS